MPVILAIDQGTTGTTCLVVDEGLRPVGRGYRELRQHFPQPGWVEHDPDEIWESVPAAAEDALADAGANATDLTAIGITNQRETTVVWERRSGRPVHRAIVWQDRRTAGRCRELPADLVRATNGSRARSVLLGHEAGVDPRAHGAGRRAAVLRHGRLVADLEADRRPRSRHRRDQRVSHDAARPVERRVGRRAARALLRPPRDCCPRSSPRRGWSPRRPLLGATVPVAGIAGDQQAALFGQGCVAPGQAKATYGTGSFVLANIGTVARPGRAGSAGDRGRGRARCSRRSTPRRDPCSSPGRLCSGCATVSA